MARLLSRHQMRGPPRRVRPTADVEARSPSRVSDGGDRNAERARLTKSCARAAARDHHTVSQSRSMTPAAIATVTARAAVALPKSPVSFARGDEVPHIFTRKPRTDHHNPVNAAQRLGLARGQVVERSTSGPNMCVVASFRCNCRRSRPGLHGKPANHRCVEFPAYRRWRSSETLRDPTYRPTGRNPTRNLFALLKFQRRHSSATWRRRHTSMESHDPLDAGLVPPFQPPRDGQHALSVLPPLPQFGLLLPSEQCP